MSYGGTVWTLPPYLLVLFFWVVRAIDVAHADHTGYSTAVPLPIKESEASPPTKTRLAVLIPSALDTS